MARVTNRRGRKRLFGAFALAVALLAAGLALAGRSQVEHAVDRVLPGPDASTFVVHSKLLGKDLDQFMVRPGGSPRSGRPLLILLHGRGVPMKSKGLGEAFFAQLDRLGARAPNVVVVNGDFDSYYHDRATGRYGSYVMREAIPQAVRVSQSDPKRIAIGGVSMGGFGALDLASLHPGRFCAVGGHSPALFRSGGETPAGAFDNAEDFSRHDLFARATQSPGAFGDAPLWLDAGANDPFLPAIREFAALLESQGQRVSMHVWRGSHDGRYWGRHMDEYLRFYTRALASC